MTNSCFSGTGLSLVVCETLKMGGNPLKVYMEEVIDYSHVLAADNRYDTASIGLVLPREYADEWIASGIGRHVVVRSHSQNTIWEGFIDKITISFGARTIEVGPLSEVGNRVYVIYTPVYANSAGMLITGTSTETPVANDTTSQAIFGILEKNLSAGECTVTTTVNEANRFRDEYLIQNAYPTIKGSFNYGSQEALIIRLECIGYWKYLDFYIYNNRLAAVLGSTTFDAKIRTILGADPNGIISTDYFFVSTNANPYPNKEEFNRTALTIIKALCAAGDSSGNRWLFGIGAGRKAYYSVIESTPFYTYHTSTTEQRMSIFGSDTPLHPWEIEAGHWYIMEDLQKNINFGSVYSNRNTAFIESVQFTAPYSFSLTEGRVSSLAQLLAYKGLGSI